MGEGRAEEGICPEVQGGIQAHRLILRACDDGRTGEPMRAAQEARIEDVRKEEKKEKKRERKLRKGENK